MFNLFVSMKKIVIRLSLIALLVMMGIIYSCVNNNQYSKDYIEKDLKVFLSECFNTDYESLLSCLSKDYYNVIKKCESNGYECNIFGLNSSATIQNYSILSLSDVQENRVTAHVKLYIDNEGDFYEKEFPIYIIYEGGKWVVDEIGSVKQETIAALEKEDF